MSDRRTAVFLQEMGVGPQWRLRNRPLAGEAEVESAAVATVAPQDFTPAPAAAPAAVAPAPVHAPVANAPTLAPQPAAVAAVPREAAAQAAPAQDAVQAASAPARAPGTPSIASTGEDMSWFDDAPTPEYKAQRKKVAAPERPPAAPAAHAAPQAASRPPAPQRPAGTPSSAATDAPADDDVPMGEPPSWFDDEQPAAGRAALPGQSTDEEIARMDWPALQAAVGACTRCGRCATRRQAVPGRGDQQASWIALDSAPGQEEDAEGYPFAGAPGQLLDNMLKAVGQSTEKGAYLSSLVKCHAPHAPSAEELQACRPYLERELELTQPKVIVAFGHSTGKGLLGSAARGRIMLHGSVPVVASYHPADLLRKPEEKAKAWQDLCLAKAAHAGRR